jgi:hypothetical protein
LGHSRKHACPSPWLCFQSYQNSQDTASKGHELKTMALRYRHKRQKTRIKAFQRSLRSHWLVVSAVHKESAQCWDQCWDRPLVWLMPMPEHIIPYFSGEFRPHDHRKETLCMDMDVTVFL